MVGELEDQQVTPFDLPIYGEVKWVNTEVVREELQGEVGEKITQSIRRFVRREIERALTLKGLE